MKAIYIALLSLALTPAFAHDEKMTDEQRVKMHEQMADAHKKAAECHKSGKPKEDCRKEFMASCMESDHKGMCKGMMMGMHKDRKAAGKHEKSGKDEHKEHHE